MKDLFEGFLHGRDIPIVEAYSVFNARLNSNFANQRTTIGQR